METSGFRSTLFLLNRRTGFPGGLVVKNLSANTGDARDTGSMPGSGRSPDVENVNQLHYSYLENSMDRGAWRATVSESGMTERLSAR